MTLLVELIEFAEPSVLPNIMGELEKFDPQRGEDMVRLSRDQIVFILERYLSSELSEENVEEWANAIEIREDVELGNNNDATTTDVVWHLANPLLSQPLTPDFAKTLIVQLRKE